MLNNKIIDALEKITGSNNIITDKEAMVDYSHDEFYPEKVEKYPSCVVKPATTNEVSEILKLANREKVAVIARGQGTGMCGACVPMKEEIILSTENLNKIVEIDTENQLAVVQSGVTLMEFYAAVEKEDLFFPPHPGEESATVGGGAATNAGGARAVKYGVFRNFIRGLEVVLADGSIINVGGKIIKNSTGYNLLNLFVGSEGTLGVITSLTIGLLPPPCAISTLIVPFNNIKDAIKVVNQLFMNRIIPLAVEFMQQDIITVAECYLEKKWPVKPAGAQLMIMIDGSSGNEVDNLSEKIAAVCMNNMALDVFIAESEEKQKEVLNIRSRMYEAIKPGVIEIFDICVPRAKIADFVDKVCRLSAEYDMWMPTFGHAADGNVHTHLMKYSLKADKLDNIEISGWRQKAPEISKRLYSYGRELGGVVSGEHGIGLVKKPYFSMTIDSRQLELMRAVKKAFDPNNILNPGKIFDM